MRTYLEGKRVLVTGANGFLGRHVLDQLELVPGIKIIAPRRETCDLLSQTSILSIKDHEPDVIIHLAAECGGIGANMAAPGLFFYANMQMGLNVIEAARQAGADKVVVIGTTCSYPADCPMPIRESDLWWRYPEPTNAPYGVAKRALGTMLQAYYDQYGLKSAYLLPANLYGPGDNFDPVTSHVIPAMIRRFTGAAESKAESVTLWGSGQVTREFLYVADAAEAIVKAADMINQPQPLNIGTGIETQIGQLADIIAEQCGFTGDIRWDTMKPDGQKRRCLNVSKASELLDWSASISLTDGLGRTIGWYRESIQD